MISYYGRIQLKTFEKFICVVITTIDLIRILVISKLYLIYANVKIKATDIETSFLNIDYKNLKHHKEMLTATFRELQDPPSQQHRVSYSRRGEYTKID